MQTARTSPRRALRSITGSLALTVATSGASATAADFLVPDDFPLPIAVQLACNSLDPVNTIRITERITITGTIDIDASCDGTGAVVIRPDVDGDRATIESAHAGPAFRLVSCERVTLQDLDVVRTWPNSTNLIEIFTAIDCTIERCRLGSVLFVSARDGRGSTQPPDGARRAAGSVLSIAYPKNVVVRNSLCFSTPHGAFSRGIEVTNMSDTDNSIFLYNNVVGDYAEYGISVQGGGLDGPLALLRNNVAVNHVDLAVEPVAYRSDFFAPGEVVTSHNVALATLGQVEVIGGGAITITADGVPVAEFLRLERPEVDDVFVEYRWFIGDWDPNVDLYRLEPAANPMHDAPGAFGQTVADGSPHPRDVAVEDDIEHDARPSGDTLHTDRGVDQLELDQLAVINPSGRSGPLRASPRTNPSFAPAAIQYATEIEGSLRLEVFDISGRRRFVDERIVTAGDTGAIAIPDDGPGVRFYRLLLTSSRGASQLSGKLQRLD